MTLPSVALEVDTREAEAFLRAVDKQVEFATIMAMNRTMEEAQARQKEGMRERFTIRREWVVQQVQFGRGERAERGRLEVTLRIDERAGFLEKFIRGGPFVMQRAPLAIPTRALRPDFRQLVEPQFYPKNVGIMTRRGPAGETVVAGRGKHSRRPWVTKRYFRMQPSALDVSGAGVWVRTGSGRGLSRGNDRLAFLWKFKSRVTVPALLQMEETVLRTFEERFEVNFEGMLAHALETAR